MANQEIKDGATRRGGVLCFASLTLALALTPAHAGDLELARSVVSGGGGASLGGENVRLDATVGQPAAGAGLSGGRFSIQLGFWTALPPALEIVSAVSRKPHGTTGTFDVPLPRTGPAGVECRTGGSGGNYQVVVTFASAVTVGGLSITSIDGVASGTHTVFGSVVTIELAGVSNAQTVGITLTNVTSGTAVGDVFVPMGVLAGDTNGNGAVTASDIGQTKAVSGQIANGANFRTDVNASGAITASDIGLVKSRAGTQLP
jgi:hypothetical protein